MPRNEKPGRGKHAGGRKKGVPKQIKTYYIEDSLLDQLNFHKSDGITFSSIVEKALRNMLSEKEGDVEQKYNFDEFIQFFKDFMIEHHADDIILPGSAIDAIEMAPKISLKLIRNLLVMKSMPIGLRDPDFFDSQIEETRVGGIKLCRAFWGMTANEAEDLFDGTIQKMVDEQRSAVAEAHARVEAKYTETPNSEDAPIAIALEDPYQEVVVEAPNRTWHKRLLSVFQR